MIRQTRTKATHRRVRERVQQTGGPRPAARSGPLARRTGHLLLATLFIAGSAASLSACGHGASDATTVLRGAEGVTVVSPAGVAHPGVEGERLTVGETIRTTAHDTALVTGGRVTTLGRSTAVDIAARSRYLLDAGTVLVDRRHGRDVRVDAGPVTVDNIGPTAVRIERGFAVRVAVFAGGSAAVTASQGSSTVSALHEIDVPGASLPAAPTPLALRDDALDRLAEPALVAADLTLDSRADALDRPGGDIVPAALIRTLPPAPSATAVSERVLPVAIARADRAAPLAAAYTRVTALRADGGSWGVVAALVDAQLGAVQHELDALLVSPATTLVLPAGTTGDAGTSAVTALLAAAAPNPAGAIANPTGLAPQPAPTSRPAGSAPASGGAPTSLPTPTPPPLVQALVNTITGLLPPLGPSTPTPSAPATARPAPAPTASGGLLGGVLGSLLGAG